MFSKCTKLFTTGATVAALSAAALTSAAPAAFAAGPSGEATIACSFYGTDGRITGTDVIRVSRQSSPAALPTPAGTVRAECASSGADARAVTLRASSTSEVLTLNITNLVILLIAKAIIIGFGIYAGGVGGSA